VKLLSLKFANFKFFTLVILGDNLVILGGTLWKSA